MHKAPKVSVCSITYNHENFIEQAIQSWLMQKTNFEIEVVIGEDNGPDNTRKIIDAYIKKYPNLIRLITSDQNVGMIKNFVRTIKACQGKYIALCEGDDYWTDSYKLQKQVDFLEANPEYGMVSSDITLIDEDGTPIPDNKMVLRQREKYKPTVDFFDLLETNHVNTLTVCARADLMKELAERVVKENLWFVYDYWFWLNISLKTKVRVFDERMAAYRIHEEGVSRRKNFFYYKKPLVKKDVFIRALKQNGRQGVKINFQILCEFMTLIFSLLINRKFDVIWRLISNKNGASKNTN